jgi:type VI secretion system VasD/TssJ family lipoprotein
LRILTFTSSLLVLLFLVCSCATKQLTPPKLEFAEDAIKIHVKADPKLNLSDGKPHTLLVCVYQLNDHNGLNQLASDEDGLYRLLECGLFDASVAGAKRLIIQPGQNATVNFDRAKGARYVAVAAGYYLIKKERMVRLYEIPVLIQKKGIIKRTKIKKLGTLEIDLKLGPQQIQ